MKILKILLFIFILLTQTTILESAVHSVTLAWNWTQGTGDIATGFYVQRSSVSGGPYTVIGTVTEITSLIFVDSNVVAGQTWFYVVTAFNSRGESTFSNQVTYIVPFQVPTAATIN